MTTKRFKILLGSATALVSATLAPAFAGPIGTTVAEAEASTTLAQRWLRGELENYGDLPVTYDGKPIPIRVTSHLPANNSLIEIQSQGWEVLERMSGGKIVAETYWSGTVHGAAEGREAVRSGITDFAPCFVQYNTNDYDLTNGLGLPYLFNNAHEAAAIAEHIYSEFLKEEFESWNVALGRYGFTSAYNLYNNVPVRSLEDLSGVKVRANGAQAEMLEKLGALPVALPISDIYQSLQTGLVDAVLFSDASAPALKLDETVDYRTVTPFSALPFENCVSPEWFAALPPDLQDVFNAWSRQMAIVEPLIQYDVGDITALTALEDAGVETIALDETESARWEAALVPMIEEWIAEQESKGLPARDMIERIRELSDEYATLTPDEILQQAIDTPVVGILP